MKINSIYNKSLKNIISCEIKRGYEDKFYYIYKIEFPNGKYYFGLHKTKNLNDGYAGSGTLLPREYGKCDISEVKKIILSFHNNQDELIEEEKKVIGDLYKNDENCLNLIEGGSYGFDKKVLEKSIKSRKGKKRSIESIEKQRKSCIGKFHTEETKKKQSNWHINFWKSDISNKKREKLREIAKNRVISNETRKKISETRKKFTKTDLYFLKKHFLYYKQDIIDNNLLEYFNQCVLDATINNLKTCDKDFFDMFFSEIKKKRIREKRELLKINKKKYIMTEEHKKHISEGKRGKKLSEEIKKKFSEMKKGRKNSNYCPNKIEMYDLNWNFIREFIDCIDACEYIKNNINKKATTKEIFVACRTGRTRYNYKWKKIV